MLNAPRIFITPGEPAGIGPEITAQIAQHEWQAELIIVCDPTLIEARATHLNLPLRIIPFDATQPAAKHIPGTLKCIPIHLRAPCTPGTLNTANATYVIECLTTAAHHCKTASDTHTSAALVTGPVHKGVINNAGVAFSGHTEFFAELFHVTYPIMLFVTDQTRVALATTHLPLSDVPKAITQELLITTINKLHTELQHTFHIPYPKITVCGLNPHAGEMGHLGREEIDCIEPALQYLRNKKIDITGPLPADSVFTEQYLKNTDAVLAMYHDQALPVVKYMSFGHAVNITLGLPIIRTSVDHGTALDIANTKQADSGSLAAAIKLAIQLSNNQQHDMHSSQGT